jgi:hypothetical protein
LVGQGSRLHRQVRGDQRIIEFPGKGTFFSSAGRWVSQPKTKILTLCGFFARIFTDVL